MFRFPMLLAAASCGLSTGGNIDLESLSNVVQVGGLTKSPVYTAFDDASWGVANGNVSSLLGDHVPKLYNQFMEECMRGSATCQHENKNRMYQNAFQPKSMINYTASGFKKVRAPPQLYQLLQEFWDLNKDKARVEYNDETAFHNSWQVPTTILMTEDDSLIGGGWNLSAAVWNAARDVLEEWTGQKLAGSSVYGIRVYHNQSVLTPHVDRLPLVSSAIINVAQDVDEDWVLEVYGHDGKATNVTMTPGDMVLYESHSVIHGRPFPLNGKFYANIFVHFQTMGDINSTETLPKVGNLPPYVIPSSDWENSYWDEFPRGWTLLTDIEELARKGDLHTLQYIAQREPKAITDPARACGLVERAIQNKHKDVLEFFFGSMGFDVNIVCQSRTPLDVAQARLSPKDDIIVFLKEMGSITYKELIKKSIDYIPRSDYRCDIIRAAISYEDVEVMEFLFEEMEYSINTVCSGSLTPLDLLVEAYEEEDPTEESDPVYAYLLSHEAKEYMDLEGEISASSAISDSRCSMIETAVPFDSISTFEFLFHIMNYDVNMICDGKTPFDMVSPEYREGHPVLEFFKAIGGKVHDEKIADLREEKIVAFEQCRTIAKAIRSANILAVKFLIEEMSYDVSMICEGDSTLMDIASKTENPSMIEFFSGKQSRSPQSQSTSDEL